MSRADWDKRIQRAMDLVAQVPAAQQVLGFYAQVAGVQKSIYEEAAAPGRGADPAKPLREQVNTDLVLHRLPELLSLAEKRGPAALAQSARELLAKDNSAWRALVEAYLQGNGQDAVAAPGTFFPRACVQPVAEYLGSTCPIHTAGFAGRICPVCNGKPQMAVLRPEGEGAKRSLACSFCQLEWEFRRILCPVCGEESHEKLPHFTAEEFPHVRVEACDTCQSYLKTVDLSANGLAVPLVDEIASASLDLWAGQHGYHKIELNLMGL